MPKVCRNGRIGWVCALAGRLTVKGKQDVNAAAGGKGLEIGTVMEELEMRMNDGRTNRISRQQSEARRRKKAIRWIFLIAGVLFVISFILCMNDVYAELDGMQERVKQLEVREDPILPVGGGAQSQGKTEPVRTEPERTEKEDPVDVPIAWEVEKPVERTEEEVLRRLEELGQESPRIKEIYENNSKYPEKLLAALANNPEMEYFVSGYPGGDEEAGGMTESEKEQDFPLFLQWDPRWGYQSYGDGCIALTGCGPTCLSMVLFHLTRDETLTPDKIASYSEDNGYYVKGSGTAWALMQDLPKQYQVTVKQISSSEANLKAALDNGSVIICAMAKGEFTLYGHFIVIRGYDSEGFIVNDPNCVARSNRRWTFKEMKSQIRNVWTYKKK